MSVMSLGSRCLRSKECGLYEAADIILGHALLKKSCEVKYIDTLLPAKRKQRVKTYEQLKEPHKMDPDSTEYFMNGLIDTHYPARPDKCEDMCLYGFVQ